MPEENNIAQPQVVHAHHFNLKKVIFTVVAVLVVTSLIAAAIYWYISRDTDSSLPGITTKQSTKSASKSSTTTPTKKDETADWSVYSDKDVSFKYPKTWYKGVLFGDGSSEGGGFGISFSNYPFKIEGDSATPLGSNKDDYLDVRYELNWSNNEATTEGPLYRRQYDFVQNMTVGSTKNFIWSVWNETLTKEANTKMGEIEAVKYTTQSKINDTDGKERKTNIIRVVVRKDKDNQKRYFKLDISYYGQASEKGARETIDKIIAGFKFL
jgi:hypothetical protein